MNLVRIKSHISSALYSHLEGCKINSLECFVLKSQTELRQMTRLPASQVDFLVNVTLKTIMNQSFVKAKDCDIHSYSQLSLGCPKLDQMLGGGLPMKSIIEIYGESGCGKTQIALQLSLTVQKRQFSGGLEAGAVYVYTENFPSKRLHQLSQYLQKDHPDKNFETNIFIKQAADIDQLNDCILNRLPVLLQARNIRLIIIDSIAAVFRYEPTADYIVRSRTLWNIADRLLSLAHEHNLVVVCTNQLTSAGENSTRSCLGLAWSSLLSYRIRISRTKAPLLDEHPGFVREMCVEFSRDMPQNTCYFTVTNRGVFGLT